jgi:hypothetical protein
VEEFVMLANVKIRAWVFAMGTTPFLKVNSATVLCAAANEAWEG